MNSDIMQNANYFLKKTKAILAKRAGYLCSNPECKAHTTGPSSDITAFITIGEAAHMYGAAKGSPRYNPFMTPAERAHIRNGIWLCCSCHTMVDADPDKYPAELLAAWKNDHEAEVVSRIGKAKELAPAKKINKVDGWEYLLAIEVLKDKLAPVICRWRSLSDGLYTKTTIRILKKNCHTWGKDQLHNLKQQVNALSLIVNKEFKLAFGEPGKQGSEAAILAACDLFVEGCERLLKWEENVHFTLFDKDYRKWSRLLKGIAGQILEQFAAIPDKLLAAFNNNTKEIDIAISLPERVILAIN
jgi:hypothetical protein